MKYNYFFNLKISPLNIFTFFLFVSALVFYCSGERKTELSEMQFEVDSTLLGQPLSIESIQLHFSPPVHWKIVSDSIFIRFRSRIDSILGQTEGFHLEVKNLFFDKASGSMASICLLDRLTPSNRLNNTMQIYRNEIELKSGSNAVKSDEFLKNNVHVFQFLIQTEDHVNFKFVFPNTQSQLIQIDYVIPKNNYAQQIKAIESSIGYFKLIKTDI